MRLIGIAAILVIIVGVGAWFAQDGPGVPTGGAPVGDARYLPDFTLPDLDDRPRSVAEWSGRSLIVNFWATWCAPCRREIPLLQRLLAERTDGMLQVVGVALDNRRDVARFVEQFGVTYPIVYGEHDAARIAESIGGDAYIGLPFSVFVAPDGEIIAVHSGELQQDDLRRIVAELDAAAGLPGGD